mmetsp:Transcript_25999/g.81633  ORF Transcript_25999/g.81633 Transcript_25999/m.81633 type:complete len:245 (+) Transcript_25999:60-794(+)
MPWTGGPMAAASATNTASFDALVTKVKEMCRSSPSVKEQWCAWCDSCQGGTKDPKRIDTESLRSFLMSYESGTPAGGGGARWVKSVPMPTPVAAMGMKGGGRGGGQEQPDLAEAVKVGQRVSPSFKAAWVGFCQMQNHKTFDPSRHTKEFLSSYFEYIGEQAAAIVPAMPTPAEGPAAKRQRTAPDPSSDPAAVALAERVKQAQREDPTKKQMWSDYCDSEAKGTKDPMRHSVQSLELFLRQCE